MHIMKANLNNESIKKMNTHCSKNKPIITWHCQIMFCNFELKINTGCFKMN